MVSAVSPGEEASPWGNPAAYFNRPPQGDIPADASYLSVILFYLFLPLNLLFALIGTFNNAVWRFFAGLALVSSRNGRPFYLAWVTWIYQPIVALRLVVRSSASRFTLFGSSRAAMGGGEWWWHGEGAWHCPYEGVRATMASDQKRAWAFGAVRAAVPEVFPAGNLLFLDGEEHKVVRGVLMRSLTNEENWGARVKDLPSVLVPLLPKPCTLQTLTKDISDKLVSTAVWYLMFGVKLTDDQATKAAAWGASGLAGYFVFPRFIHRVAFGLLMSRIKQLRMDMIDIVRAHRLESKFEMLNDTLGVYKRPTALELCDEFMYAVNFAGVGGTQHGTWAMLKFMQRQTVDVPVGEIAFPKGSLPELFKANPDGFIKEAVRLDAPVTSACCVFKEDTTVRFDVSCCGGSVDHRIATGTPRQYVLSIANRDPAVFSKPNQFDPTRPNINDMLGWNGAISNPSAYPRFCPGHWMSMAIMRTIGSLVDEVKNVTSA